MPFRAAAFKTNKQWLDLWPHTSRPFFKHFIAKILKVQWYKTWKGAFCQIIYSSYLISLQTLVLCVFNFVKLVKLVCCLWCWLSLCVCVSWAGPLVLVLVLVLMGSQRTVDVHTGWGFFYFLMSLRPPGQWQASHILCKYALVRSSAGAFSPVRSPQILISQVTVVDLQPVCCCRHNRSSFTDKFLGVWGPFFAFPATAAVCFSLLLTTSVVIKFHLSLDFLFYISIAVFGFFSGRTLIYILNNCIISP